MPSQKVRRGYIPSSLVLKHVQERGDNEDDSTNKIGQIVHPLDGTQAHVVVDGWDGTDATNVEDSRTDRECDGRHKTNLVDIVRLQLLPRWPPGPLAVWLGLLRGI